MSAQATHGETIDGAGVHGPGERLRRLLLALTVFSGALVLVDVVYNILVIACVGLFFLGGLKLDRLNVPMIVLLIIYNLGGNLAAHPYPTFEYSAEFVIGTAFVGISGIFFALMLNENALARMQAVKWGAISGALVAGGAGLLGYFDIAGLGEVFTLFGRASGTFRDPNVLGPFLVLPALYLIHDVVVRPRVSIVRLGMAGVVCLALLLTFSRGAWGGFALGFVILLVGLRLTTEDGAIRVRVLQIGLLILALLGVLIAIALSIEEIASVLADRFTLAKEYDSGPLGRFGSQVRAIPLLLERPLGFGPNRFWLHFPENPHNTYINAFASYGWLGGFAFLVFITATLVAGFSAVARKSAVQAHALVVFAALVPHLMQNLQIDTDRWRHLFMLYGLSWGLAVASLRGARPASNPNAPPRYAALGASAAPSVSPSSPARFIRLA